MRPAPASNTLNTYIRLYAFVNVYTRQGKLKQSPMPEVRFPVTMTKRMAEPFCRIDRAPPYYISGMEKRHCLECGVEFSGRSDKRFCSDACRNCWHNSASRQSKAYSYRINSLLHRNHSILSECRSSGRSRIKRKEMEEKLFSERYFTACSRRLLGRPVYMCYDISYMIEGRRGIRILSDRQPSPDARRERE